MRMRALLAALLLLGGMPALAQTQLEGTLTLGGKVVALPPGQWRVLHLATEPGRTADGGTPITTHRAVLVQERGGQAAAVIIATALTEVGMGWSPHGICTNANAIQRQVVSAMWAALDCRGIAMVGSGRGPNTAAYLSALYDEGQRRPGWIPPRWLAVQVLLNERMHHLSVEYRYAPNIFAPAAATGANWNEGARNAAQQTAVEQLAAFSTRAHAELQRGLYGRQPGAPLPSPF